MHLAFFAALCAAGAAAAPVDIIGAVRAAVARQDFAGAQAQLQAWRAQRGATPEWLEAFSWLGRGAFAAGAFDQAGRWASETHTLALEMLRGRALDAEPHLPTALGAAIEVRAQVLAAGGERAEAVAWLREQLARYGETSIGPRIQKNINLLSLEGKPAPALDLKRWIGPRPAPLAQLIGRPVLLFFWAHWCGDCKAEVPEIAKLREDFPDLALVAPTQCYGYTAGGREAPCDLETAYIGEVWKRYYATGLGTAAVPLSADNFREYGASTTPTLVLLDRHGVVRMYHPGMMSYADLAARLRTLMVRHAAR